MSIKHIILLSIILLFSITINAQTAGELEIIQYLESQLDSTDNDIEKIKINLQIVNIALNSNADLAIHYLKEIKKLKRKTTPQPILSSKIYKAWGDAYFKKGNQNKAFDYYNNQLSVLQNAGINADSVLYNLASLEYKQGLYTDAAIHYEELIAKPQDDPKMVTRLTKSLYLSHKNAGNYEQALNYLEKYLEDIDGQFYAASQQINILNDKVSQGVVKLNYTKVQLDQTQYVLNITEDSLTTTTDSLTVITEVKDSLSFENKILLAKKQRHDIVREHKTTELHQKQKKVNRKDKELAQRKKMISLLGFIIFLTIIGGSLIFILYRRIAKKNLVLKTQKKEIQNQKNLIEEKNEQITESIFYASNIQRSILPPKSQILKYFPHSFIFFKPRDIVSGDFYWFSKIQDKLIISAIDCTGHGVPGAFISMIGNTLLNQIVNENKITEPNIILDHLHDEMKDALQQTGSEVESEDGMDLVLCSIEPDKKILTFSGAKNSLLVYDNNEFNSYKGDFVSIGEKPLRPGMKTKFKNKTIEYNNNTQIFLMTDGLIDQFGYTDNGEEEKYNYQRLKNIITENIEKSRKEMDDIINLNIKNWIKNNEQTDDMLVIGIKLSDVKID